MSKWCECDGRKDRHGACRVCGKPTEESDKALDKFVEMVRDLHTKKHGDSK